MFADHYQGDRDPHPARWQKFLADAEANGVAVNDLGFIWDDRYDPGDDIRIVKARLDDLHGYDPVNSLRELPSLLHCCHKFSFGKRLGLFFFQQNNEVLAIMRLLGVKLSCFIGRNDGCEEGGNYGDCVNEALFFKRLIPMIPAEGMKYLTDHSNLVDPDQCAQLGVRWYFQEPGESVYAEGFRFEFVKKHTKTYSNYMSFGKVAEFKVTKSAGKESMSRNRKRERYEDDDCIIDLSGF